ncbi:hypothetical protein [Neotabrizicola sp. sgz301269]|uniref:hypothetical protein n=1 Tax=Neotabrizicola sp. sgz301269 TaxID=3276282 RepID=UPI00376FFC9A
MKFRPALAAAALLVATGNAALADGTFFQVDIAGQTQTVVASGVWGRFGAEVAASKYEGGHDTGAALSFGIPLGSATLRIGPSIGWSDDRGTQTGGKVALENYSPTSFGGLYALGFYNTVDDAWFLLGQVSHGASGFGLELSRGGSDNYHETTVALQKRLGGGDLSLRGGYKFDSEEAFIGFSVNTF